MKAGREEEGGGGGDYHHRGASCFGRKEARA